MEGVQGQPVGSQLCRLTSCLSLYVQHLHMLSLLVSYSHLFPTSFLQLLEHTKLSLCASALCPWSDLSSAHPGLVPSQPEVPAFPDSPSGKSCTHSLARPCFISSPAPSILQFSCTCYFVHCQSTLSAGGP